MMFTPLLCTMWKEMIEKIVNQKEKNIIISIFFNFFFFLTKILFCYANVLIIWLNFMHHIIII
jgi:hypothetical protein